MTAAACFVITGEWLTEMARNLLLSEDPGRAYRLLADGLSGDGASDAALGVLKGTHDLVGDSSTGLELVEAEDTETLRSFRKDFRYIYAGRYQEGRKWWRPVAWITHLGQKDGEWASDQLEGDTGNRASDTGARKLMRFSRQRAQFYCAPDEQPVVLDLPEEGSVWVVFEVCGELPHWLRPNNITAQEALDEALAVGRRLEQRSPPPVEEEKPRANILRFSDEDLAREEAEAERRDAERQKRLHQIGEEVRAQAGEDTFPLPLKDGRVLTVPRAPFVRWALSRTNERDKAPPWEPVSRSGEKMSMDDPNHTDWVLGAGLELSEAYNETVNEAAIDAMFRIQEEAREEEKPKYAGIFAALEGLRINSHKAATLCDFGEVVGVVGTDIVVLPDSRGERVKELGACRAVIVEKGGPLAHLIVVSKGNGLTVMRCPKARELFAPGVRVSVNPQTGRIVVLDEE